MKNKINRYQKFSLFSFYNEKKKIQLPKNPPFSISNIEYLYKEYINGKLNKIQLKKKIEKKTYKLEEYTLNKLFNNSLVISKGWEKSERENIRKSIQNEIKKYINLDLNFKENE